MSTTETEDISWLIALFDQATVETPYIAQKPAAVIKSKYCTCTRCGGSGQVPQFRHIKGGECFKCKGAGKIAA
jgi:DnaJ-class molecular chaperone